MNLILHWHLARREVGSGLAGAAAMLPDVWRMADRTVRPSRGQVSREGASEALREVLDGIEHHVSADGWFHRAPVFLDGEREVAERLRAAAIDAPKLGLFAHVLWEMLLDGALLRRDGLDATLGLLRPDVARLGAYTEDALGRHRPSEARAGEADGRARVGRRTLEILEALAAGPWMAGYRDGAGVTARLEGIRLRLGLPALTAGARARLAAALGELEPAADRAIGDGRLGGTASGRG